MFTQKLGEIWYCIKKENHEIDVQNLPDYLIN